MTCYFEPMFQKAKRFPFSHYKDRILGYKTVFSEYRLKNATSTKGSVFKEHAIQSYVSKKETKVPIKIKYTHRWVSTGFL